MRFWIALAASTALAACATARSASPPPALPVNAVDAPAPAPPSPASAPTPAFVPFALEIAAFREADRRAAPAACQVLFVGSSSIRLWRSLAEDFAPEQVLNRGFGGATIADVNRHFGAVVGPYQPRAIVFYAGENDLSAGAAPEKVTADFETFMAMKAQSLGPTPVYFISLKPSRLRFGQLGQQARVNAAVRAMSETRPDLIYIDVTEAMLENGAPRDLFQADGLHMTAAGYRLWAEAVHAALDAPAPSRAPGCGQVETAQSPQPPGGAVAQSGAAR